MIWVFIALPGQPSPPFSVWKKINPLWWLDVSDGPMPDQYLIDKPAWWRYIAWRTRNPALNFRMYIIGVSDRDRIVSYSPGDEGRGLFTNAPGVKRFLTKAKGIPFNLPGWSIWWKCGSWHIEFAIGWSDSGVLNFKLRRTINGKNFAWEPPK